MEPLHIYQVDAFTDRPFAGNPAGVCILAEAMSEQWMQDVAREMNLSETAFLLRDGNGFHLRWFTPSTEVELCGHATLASAHVLWEAGYLWTTEQIEFYTLSGLLTAVQADGVIELDFPADHAQETPPPAGLLEAMGVSPIYVGKGKFDYLLELESEAEVRQLAPDFRALKAINARGIIVTGRATAGDFDFVSRFFAPATGIDEDPVTGSAHCCLAPYWAAKLSKNELIGFQASQRGGVVRVRLNNERVVLGGQAVTTLRGDLLANQS